MKMYEYRLKFPRVPINNIPAVVRIMTSRPTSQQAMIWTNDGLLCWRMNASPGFSELKLCTSHHRLFQILQNDGITVIHSSGAIMGVMTPWLFTQPFVQAQIKVKYHSSASLVRGIDRWSANSPHKGLVTRKMFPFDDVITNTWELI